MNACADAFMGIYGLSRVSEVRDEYEVARAVVHRRVDENADAAIRDVQVQARAAKAEINRRAGQRVRRMAERLQGAVVGRAQ